MDKVTRILEKNVQWIALGLAALWMGYVGWYYGIEHPVSITIKGEAYAPADADPMVKKAADRFAPKLNQKSQVAIVVPNYIDEFDKQLKSAEFPALASTIVGSAPQRNALSSTNITTPGVGGPVEKVAKLPEIPEPTQGELNGGKSLVQVILAGPPVNNPAALPPAGERPRRDRPKEDPEGGKGNVNPARPAAGAAGAAAPLVPAAANQADLTWVTFFAKYPVEDLIANFKAENVPDFLAIPPLFIEVQLQRQEVLPNGNLGPILMVPPLPMNAPKIDKLKDIAGYINWAGQGQNQELILQPPFYPVLKGNPWGKPQDPAVAAANAAAANPDDKFDALAAYQKWKTMAPGEQAKLMQTLTSAQRMALNKVRLDEEEKERKAKAAARPKPAERAPSRSGGRTGGTRGGVSYNIDDPNLFKEQFADNRAAMEENERRQRAAGVRPPGPARPPVAPGEQPFNPQGFQPQQPLKIGGLVPNKDGDIDIWAHDETAEPGKIYRYRIRVIVKNPVYGAPTVCKDPKLAEIPYLPVDPNASWSNWSGPVAIPSNADLQLIAGPALGKPETARFSVWRWQKGESNKLKDTGPLGPGDIVGGVDKNTGVDFTTNWTIVDIRTIGNDVRVRLMSDDGRIETRSLNSDRANKRFDNLELKPAVIGLNN